LNVKTSNTNFRASFGILTKGPKVHDLDSAYEPMPCAIH